MIRRADEREQIVMTNAFDGMGSFYPTKLIQGDEFIGAGRLFNLITFPVGSSIGYHVHIGEMEVYVITSGKGLYNDNGVEVEVYPGDVTYCAPGEGHGLINTGDEDLKIIALVLFDKR